MIVWKSDEIEMSEAFAHYQIVRRNGSVVPFEPCKIAEAMMKAFLAVHGALSDRKHGKCLAGRLLSIFGRGLNSRGQTRSFALDFRRTILALGGRALRGVSVGLRVSAGVGGGFFSAVKPNLRNAP